MEVTRNGDEKQVIAGPCPGLREGTQPWKTARLRLTVMNATQCHFRTRAGWSAAGQDSSVSIPEGMEVVLIGDAEMMKGLFASSGWTDYFDFPEFVGDSDGVYLYGRYRAGYNKVFLKE
jgi:hypothetical protein